MTTHNTMQAQSQRDSLRRLTDNSFFVPVTIDEVLAEEESSARTTIHIQCREMPLETLLTLIAELIYRLGAPVLESSGEIIGAKLKQLQASDDPEQQSAIMQSMIGTLLPAFMTALPSMPDLIRRVLQDCIIGATPDDVKRIGVSPSLAILTEIVSRVETEEARTHFAAFFATLWSRFGRKK